MKNFSELLDTKQVLVLRLDVQPVSDNGFPELELIVNGTTFKEGPLQAGFGIVTALPLLVPVTVELKMSNKKYNAEKETAVVIERFDIDEIDIVPTYSHCATYENDHNDASPTSYLGYNGSWKFDTKVPFYNWLHLATGQGWLLRPKQLTVSI